MRAPAFLLALAFAAGCSNGFWSCGPYSPCCSARAEVIRDATYLGTIPGPSDGGPTQVRLVVQSDAGTRLTFIKDGVEIVQTFDGPR